MCQIPVLNTVKLTFCVENVLDSIYLESGYCAASRRFSCRVFPKYLSVNALPRGSGSLYILVAHINLSFPFLALNSQTSYTPHSTFHTHTQHLYKSPFNTHIFFTMRYSIILPAFAAAALAQSIVSLTVAQHLSQRLWFPTTFTLGLSLRPPNSKPRRHHALVSCCQAAVY